MKTFPKPPVGASISVTTRYKETYIYAENEWRDTTYTGKVLPDEKWFKPGDFKLSSDEPHMSFRVINLKNVIDLKVGGQDVDQEEVDDGTQLVPIKGKKGNQYWVTIKDGSAQTCTCPGFMFRNRCRHLNEAMGQVDSVPEMADTRVSSRPVRRTANSVQRGNVTMSKSKTLGWNDRFALIDHYKPSDEQACTAFGVTPDELKTARDMRAAGAFTATPGIDVDSYASLFAAPAAPETAAPSTKSTKRRGGATKTTKTAPTTDGDKPATATKKTKVPRKRGRKGDKIANAFRAIPTDPTPVAAFATTHGVSVAVLRQSKRFDKSTDLGSVKVKKDKETKELMIWREAPTS